MVAYVRISDQEILTHEPVTHPDAVLVLDETLMEVINSIKGLTKDGILIINSSKKDQKNNIKYLDASKIALEFIKKDKPNTPMLGALVKITQIVKLENLIKVVEKHFLNKIGEQGAITNVMAIKEGYDKMNQRIKVKKIKSQILMPNDQ